MIQTWFPYQEIQLQKLYEMDEFERVQRKLSEQGGAVYKIEGLKDEEKYLSEMRRLEEWLSLSMSSAALSVS